MATLVRHAMTEAPQTAKPGMTAADGAALMRQLDIGAVPIAEDGRLIGLVTDRDLVIRVLAERKDPSQVSLSEIVTKSPVTISPDAKLSEAMDLMADHRVRSRRPPPTCPRVGPTAARPSERESPRR